MANANLIGTSTDSKLAGVKGECTGDGGYGVWGICATGHGVHGESKGSRGVAGTSETFQGVYGKSNDGIGVVGESKTNEGVRGISHGSNAGVAGVNDSSSPPGAGGDGGWFESTQGVGVRGISHGSNAGVAGVNDGANGDGGWFESTQGEGVRGTAKNPNHGGVVGLNTAGGAGVYGTSDNGVGVWATSVNYEGIHAVTNSPVAVAIAAYNLNPAGTGAAVYAKKEGSVGHAGFFDGNVWVGGELGVKKDISLANADCAEEFDIANADLVEPGTVMVLGDDSILYPSHSAYDTRVTGVVSGAGNYKPGIVLDKQRSQLNRKPIALLGNVYCNVDAQFGPIGAGWCPAAFPSMSRSTQPPRVAAAVTTVTSRLPSTSERGLSRFSWEPKTRVGF